MYKYILPPSNTNPRKSRGKMECTAVHVFMYQGYNSCSDTCVYKNCPPNDRCQNVDKASTVGHGWHIFAALLHSRLGDHLYLSGKSLREPLLALPSLPLPLLGKSSIGREGGRKGVAAYPQGQLTGYIFLTTHKGQRNTTTISAKCTQG